MAFTFGSLLKPLLTLIFFLFPDSILFLLFVFFFALLFSCTPCLLPLLVTLCLTAPFSSPLSFLQLFLFFPVLQLCCPEVVYFHPLPAGVLLLPSWCPVLLLLLQALSIKKFCLTKDLSTVQSFQDSICLYSSVTSLLLLILVLKSFFSFC